jgi:hypothetical protein
VLIGGFDRTGIYLMTPTSYDLVCAYKRRAGQIVLWSQQALIQMLEQDGLLMSTDADGRHKAIVRVINGQRVRWWQLPVTICGARCGGQVSATIARCVAFRATSATHVVLAAS